MNNTKIRNKTTQDSKQSHKTAQVSKLKQRKNRNKNNTRISVTEKGKKQKKTCDTSVCEERWRVVAAFIMSSTASDTLQDGMGMGMGWENEDGEFIYIV
jgi:hypothetical protein